MQPNALQRLKMYVQYPSTTAQPEDIKALLAEYESSQAQSAAYEARIKVLGTGFETAQRLLQQYTKRDAYVRLWPNHCQTCGAAGYWSHWGRTAPEDDAGPCSVCVENEICPRCGKDWLDACDGPEHEICPHCGWETLNPDCCPDVQIDPADAEFLDAARTALQPDAGEKI